MAKKTAPPAEPDNSLTEEETSALTTLHSALGKLLGVGTSETPAAAEDDGLNLDDETATEEGPTEADVRAALKAFIASRGATGKTDAAKIIKKAGGVDKLADLTDDKYQAVIDLAVKNTK